MTSTLSPRTKLTALQVFGEPHLHTDGELLLLAFAPSGDLLTLEEPGVLRRWDAATGRQLEWHALSDLETLWCFAEDGRVLASASDDLTVWDASSGQSLTSVRQDSWVTALAFHRDPSFLATGHDDGTINYWDAAGHHNVFGPLRRHAMPISAVAFSPDGKLLAAAGEDRVISLWDLTSGEHVGDLLGHTDRIPALAWHPSGDVLVSAGWDTTARVWDVERREPVFIMNDHAMQVTALAFNRDGTRIATADSALVTRVGDLAARKLLHKLTGPQAEVRALAFSPDGQRLAAAGDRLIHLWDVATGQASVGTGPRPVTKTSIAVANGRLVTNGGGLAVRVLDAENGDVVRELPANEPVHAIACSPDGTKVVGATGHTVRVWDAATGAVLADWDGPEQPVTTVAFSPDGTLVASASSSGEEVWVWRAANGEPLLLIPDALDGCTVESLAFHPRGKLLAVGGVDWLATGGSDGAVSLWHIEERCEVATFAEGSTAVAFEPSGARLFTASLGQSVCVWDVAGKDLADELLGHDATVTALAVSPDGRWVASAGDDHELHLWTAEGKDVAAFEVDSRITGLAFSADGQALFTAHANATCGRVAVKDLVGGKK